jgi:O-phosphoseryl-tRNA(Cys) synthetase
MRLADALRRDIVSGWEFIKYSGINRNHGNLFSLRVIVPDRNFQFEQRAEYIRLISFFPSDT